MVGAASDVLKSSRPASSLIADPPVFEGPGGDAVAGQRRRELAAMSDVVLGQPAASMDEDGDRVIVMGHSAGGHLALWLAARSRLPAEAPIGSTDPLAVRGVLALAPAPDLQFLHEKKVCGHVIDKLMGGSPELFPDRYRWGDPMQLKPDGVRQVLIIGKHDDAWAPPGRRYFNAAEARGDDIRIIDATDAGHFELIDPDSTTWPLVLAVARKLLSIAGD